MAASNHVLPDVGNFAGFSQGADNGARAKFLSRLFGIFSEDVVKHWCECAESPYENHGRPTVREIDDPGKFSTLDFTLRHRDTKKTFVSEMKCEIEYESFGYLTGIKQIERHKKESKAFERFLRMARSPDALCADLKRGGKREPIQVQGAILIWGVTTPEGRDAVMEKYGFKDVLSLEAMVSDLHAWEPVAWTKHVSLLRKWCNELFDFLT